MISWFTSGPWTHVDYVLSSGDLLGSRLYGGVLIRSPNYANFSSTQRVSIPVSTDSKVIMEKFLYLQIGKPYNIIGIIGFAAGRNWRQSNAWFCSEMIAAGMEQANIFPHLLSSPTNKVTPNNLLLAISAITDV